MPGVMGIPMQAKGRVGQDAAPQKETYMLDVASENVATKSRVGKTETPLFAAAKSPEVRRATEWLAARIVEGERAPYSVVGTLTPAIAEMLLARNDANRNLSEITIVKYAEDIQGGRWQLNGEPIIVSRDGLLNDGQHRCKAVVKAGVAIQTVFTFGVERASRLTVDQGLKRTVGHFLAMDGVENAKQIAAAAAMAWQYDTHGVINQDARLRPTPTQLQEYIAAHPALSESATFVNGHRRNHIATNAILCACHFIFARVDAVAADYFIARLMSGVDLSERDPIYVCREKVRSIGKDSGRMPAARTVEYIIRAWNAHRSGRTMQKMQVGQNYPRAR